MYRVIQKPRIPFNGENVDLILFHETVLNAPLKLAGLHSDFVLLCLSLQSDIGMKNIDSLVDINRSGTFQNAKKNNNYLYFKA